MKLQLLVCSVLLRLGVATPTDDDCQALTTPVSLKDRSVLSGRAHLLYGYTDSDAYNALLNVTQSSYFNMTVNDQQVTIYEQNNINGTCFGMTVKLDIKDDTITMSALNVTSYANLLPTADGCFVFYGNSTAKNLGKVLQMFNVHVDDVPETLAVRSLYFFGKESSDTEELRQSFRKQAACLGFTREPDYHHHHEHSFCKEGEGVEI